MGDKTDPYLLPAQARPFTAGIAAPPVRRGSDLAVGDEAGTRLARLA